MKSHVIKIKNVGFIAAIVLICAAVAVTFVYKGLPAVISASASERKIPIYCVDYEDKKASLSFDAAWGNEDTQMLIDILGKYNVKATFFVVEDWVDKYPESVKALSDAGHEIMNHSDTHPHMSQLGRDGILKEINSCNEKIASITGVTPILHRAPYGEYNNTLIETLDSINMKCIQWDVDSLDWKDLSATEINNRVTKNVKPGSIILFHNAAKHTPEALPSIIETLQADGYELVPISELIMYDNYEIDHTGKQKSTQSTSEQGDTTENCSSSTISSASTN